jgi:hypothetical protein
MFEALDEANPETQRVPARLRRRLGRRRILVAQEGSMRATHFPIVAVCLLASVTASAQGGGKKHHKNDSTSAATTTTATASTATANTPGAGGPITFKSGVTVSTPFFVASDPTFKSDVTVSTGEIPAQEIFVIQSFPPFKGKGYTGFSIKWPLIDNRGYVQIAFDNRAEWFLGGQYDNKNKGTQYFELVFAFKKKDGQVLLFHFVGEMPPGNYTWGGQAPVDITGLPFDDFRANGYQVRGAYRVLPKKVAHSEAQGRASPSPCSTMDKTAPGWGVIWSWADPGKSCTQYNYD